MLRHTKNITKESAFKTTT